MRIAGLGNFWSWTGSEEESAHTSIDTMFQILSHDAKIRSDLCFRNRLIYLFINHQWALFYFSSDFSIEVAFLRKTWILIFVPNIRFFQNTLIFFTNPELTMIKKYSGSNQNRLEYCHTSGNNSQWFWKLLRQFSCLLKRSNLTTDIVSHFNQKS